MTNATFNSVWEIAVPCCRGELLEFYSIDAINELVPGRFGILEPASQTNQEKLRFPTDEDLLIIPGLAFTRAGIRLGRGAGYYDRYLSTVSAPAKKIGLAYERQVFPVLPEESFDIRMNFLVTESEIIPCKNSLLHEN